MIYNFNLLKELTGEEILERISEEDIYNYYLGITIRPNKLHKCCFHNDKTPSLGFYKSSKYLNFNCFGCNQNGNVFNFVSKLFNVNYYQSLKIISNDFNLIKDKKIIKKPDKIISSSSFENLNKVKIYPTFRPYNKIDYDYWNRYYLSLDFIYNYNLRSCKTVYYHNSLGEYRQYCIDSKSNPVYCYTQSNHHSIYRPLNENKIGKWFKNIDNWDIQGIENLPESGDLLFITSSLKDVMVLRLLGYYAIAPHGEGMHIPDKIMDYLFATWKRIIIFYDNDEAGIKTAIKLSELYNIEYIFIPIEYMNKDISDFIETYDISSGKELMIELLKWMNNKF